MGSEVLRFDAEISEVNLPLVGEGNWVGDHVNRLKDSNGDPVAFTHLTSYSISKLIVDRWL